MEPMSSEEIAEISRTFAFDDDTKSQLIIRLTAAVRLLKHERDDALDTLGRVVAD